MLPSFPVQGGCLCGAVRYSLLGAPLAVYNCHCRDCQRQTGSTHGMSMPVNRSNLRQIQGETEGFEKRADSGRTVRRVLCTACGTNVWNEPLSAPDLLILKPGTLDDPGWARPIGNIWVASKAPWIEIDSNLLNYDHQPPTRDMLYAAWKDLHAMGDENGHG